MATSRTDLTYLLQRPEALDELSPRIYAELKRLALSHLRRERREHTLQPTALVHEAFIRLVHQQAVRWQSRAHFFGIAAQLMRRILIDHARTRHAGKRGGRAERVPLDPAVAEAPRDVDLLALDEALTRLAARDPRQARIVELKFFGGLTLEEIGEVLQTSTATVSRDWTMARAWLYAALRGPGT